MSLDLTDIQNIGEFYSHHFLDALFDNDLKGLFAKWREDDETTPDRHLYRLVAERKTSGTQVSRMYHEQQEVMALYQ